MGVFTSKNGLSMRNLIGPTLFFISGLAIGYYYCDSKYRKLRRSEVEKELQRQLLMKQLQQIAHRSRYKLDKLDPEYQDFEELTEETRMTLKSRHRCSEI